PQENYEELTSILTRLLSSLELRKMVGQAARDYGSQQYGLQNWADRFDRLLERILFPSQG
ncbi:MAG: glycosyltransferase, partial [Candidatus Saccharicenans sp.]